jgi:YesN/AraC family two-component response regulator
MNFNLSHSNLGPERPTHRSVTVLVVDDEPMIRDLLGMMLRLRGCEVLTAKNGAEAIAMATALEGAKIDILITDLCMPGMSGADLAAEMRVIRPDTKQIFISGYTPEEIAAMGIDAPDAEFVMKPFRQGAIDTALRALLTRNRAAV